MKPQTTEPCPIEDLCSETNRCLIREIAEAKVLRVRGGYDAPGFESCVKEEIKRIRDA